MCPRQAASDGPWDSADMQNTDNDQEVKVAILTKSEFAGFMHGQMVAMGFIRG